MFDRNEIDFGDNDEEFKLTTFHEIVEVRIYEIFHQVQPGDVVVDIGANMGLFPYSLKYSNPSRVVCVEPSFSMVKALERNLSLLPFRTTILNCGIAKDNGTKQVVDKKDFIYGTKQDYFYTKTFRDMLREEHIHQIDFLKIDCEGYEYDVFTPENLEFIRNNVKYIAGEWHLSGIDDCIRKFKEFRDTYLKGSSFRVFEPYVWKEVTEEVMTKDDYVQSFYDWWGPHGEAQLIVYIDNTKGEFDG